MADQEQPKPKRVMTPEALASLAAAREKAAAKRREMGDVTRKAKALKELDLASKKAQVELEIKQVVEHKRSHQRTKNKAKQPPPSSDDDDDDDDDEDDDKENVPPTPPRRKNKAPVCKPRTQIAPLLPLPQQHDNATLSAAVARQELQRRIMADNFRTAYASMFGVAPPDYMTL